MRISFESIKFQSRAEEVECILLNNFHFFIPKCEFEKIGGEFKIDAGGIIYADENKKYKRKVLFLLDRHISGLKNKNTGNEAVYVHKNSGIPLIGSNYFGLVYRNTNIIEIKPQTSCNLNCIYCSVGEGRKSKQRDFVVEREYIVEESRKLAGFIGEPVEVHIGVQGEPFLYAEIFELIEDLSSMENVYKISMDTNGTLLTKSGIDRLSNFSKLRLNISLNSLDEDITKKMAGGAYNVKHVVKMIRYCAGKVDFLIAPLYLPGYNDAELVKLVEFAKELESEIVVDHPFLCIQNFLNYKTGRNPVKGMGWEEFVEKLKDIERRTGYKLLFDFKKDFIVKKSRELEKPFVKGDIVKGKVVSGGRFYNSMLVVSGGRSITVFDCESDIGKDIRIKIIRDKHNIFFGVGVWSKVKRFIRNTPRSTLLYFSVPFSAGVS